MSEHKRCGCVEQYHASDCPACRGTGLIPPVTCDEWDSARDELFALRARVAELEKALDAEKKQSAFYDLQAQRIMIQRDAAESRASAAVEAHAQLLSRIAGDGTLGVMERAAAAEQRAGRMDEALRRFLLEHEPCSCELCVDARAARAASESEVSHGERRRVEIVALEVLKCALSLEPEACILGNATAAEVAALAAEQITTCPKCGAEAWVNIDCDLCDLGSSLHRQCDEAEAEAPAREGGL